MSGPDETRTQPLPPPDVVHPDGGTRDFDCAAATGSFADRAAGGAECVAVPGYEILHEIGRGAMGVVYKARDTRLNRDAALKMILGGARADRRQLIRFLAEAEAVAAIRHANVVQVYEFGEHDGRPFLALEYLAGGTLAERLAASPIPDPAALVGKIARGVEAAHALGIVHRDLKPANVLLSGSGEPKVTDFGLAKKAGGADLTRTGAVMGTPAYMAPEQACGGGKFVGPPADVWALGVVLYECIAGVRPFQGETLGELLAAVENATPAAPRSLIPAAPRDLELICLKCLEKNPADRYPTAKELADDLERFVRGEPVSVRPAGALERGYKWAKRKPALAGLYAFALLAAVLVAVGVGFAHLWREAEEARGKAVVSRDDAEDARQKIAVEKAREAEQRRLAEGARDDAQKARTTLTRLEYARTIDLAHRVHREGNLVRTRELLATCAAELRGWEWDHLNRQASPELLRVETADHFRAVAFTPDGKRVVTVGDADVVVWDAATGARVRTLRGVAPSTDGFTLSADLRRVAAVSQVRIPDGTVRLGVDVWDLETGKRVASLTAPPVPEPTVRKTDLLPFLTTVVSAPTGRQFALLARPRSGLGADSEFWLWDADTGKELATPKSVAYDPDAVQHTPAGWRFYATRVESSPGQKSPPAKNTPVPTAFKLLVFDLAGTELTSLPLGGPLPQLTPSPDGQRVLRIGGVNDFTRPSVLDFGTGKRHTGPVGSTAARFSPDGRRVVWLRPIYTTEEDTRRAVVTYSLWLTDADGGRQTALSGRFAGEPTFSPDGRWMVTTGDDRMVRVWNSETTTELFSFREDAVSRARRAALDEQPWSNPAESPPPPAHFAFSPDGSRLAAATPEGVLRVWDAGFRPPPTPVPAADPNVVRVATTPTAWRILAGFRPMTVWNPDTGDGVEIKPNFKPESEVVFSPDHTLMAGTTNDDMYLWEVETGKRLRTLGSDTRSRKLTFSPDGWRLATIDATDNTLRVRELSTGAEVFAAAVVQNRGVTVRFSPDGRRVKFLTDPVPPGTAAANIPPPVKKREWNLDTKAEVETPADDDAPPQARFAPEFTSVLGKPREAVPPAVSPDGRRRAEVGSDAAVRLFDAATNQELLTLTERRGDISGVAFHSDGWRILVVGAGGAEVFDATARTPVSILLPVAPVPRVSTRPPPPEPKKRPGSFPEMAAAWEDLQKDLKKQPAVAPPPRPKP